MFSLPGCFEGIEDPLILRVPVEAAIAREILNFNNSPQGLQGMGI
jgi:hypothetical protein